MEIIKYQMGSVEHQEQALAEADISHQNRIVVYNDEVNTFDHVINTLIEVCKHNRQQAEQCTMLIHYRGKCSVKEGNTDELKPMCEAILDRGIQAELI